MGQAGPTLEIDWTPVSYRVWQEHFSRVRRPTLLQHFAYAKAERVVNQRGVRNGIIKIDGEAAGLVQLGESALFAKAIHVVSLDRGPLWFPGFETADNVAAFFSEFARQFPRRWGRKMRILPEVEESGPNRTMLVKAGLTRNDKFEGYQTLWVDLAPDEERLHARLESDFRRMLAKSDRSALEVKEDWGGDAVGVFLANYEADRDHKGYAGAGRDLLEALLGFMVPQREALILTGHLDGRVVAGVLLLVHGTGATYQAGFNLEQGRKVAAHHALLWRGMLALKARGVTDFDLGGVNEGAASGVAKFKRQLGGRGVTLVGFYS